MNEYEITAVKAVEAFCKSELSEYSYFEGWKVTETEYYNDKVYVDVEIRETTVRFKVFLDSGNPEDCKLFVETNEDCYYAVDSFDWTVKYFWMALLPWPD